MDRSYGTKLPGVDATNLPGKLIAIEGTDGSGRSTQIRILTSWLEGLGYAVENIGLKRSNLVGTELEQAKMGNVLGHTTMSLFYATDFADQLENKLIPALRAGFIVLADRYIYTLMARDIVRGGDPEWVRSLYSIALKPDSVFYMMVSPRELVLRNYRKNAMLDYWESGMDIMKKRDIYKSFIGYQKRMQAEFRNLASEYGFKIINGNRTPRQISEDLKKQLMQVLNINF